jgi:hypothetical protein
MIGVHRPFLSQTLSEFERMGLIRCGRGRIQLLERDGLEAHACEDYRTTHEEYQRLL